MSASLPLCHHPYTGRDKTTYRSKAKAMKSVRAATETLRPYKCRHCEGWHLSSQPQRKEPA